MSFILLILRGSKYCFTFQINLDFERLYPQAHIALHLNWEWTFNKILDKKINEIKDINAQNLYKQLLEKTDEGEYLKLNDNSLISLILIICYIFLDEKFPIQFLLLNYLLPPRGRTKNWKFSVLESIEGVILHVQVSNNNKGVYLVCVFKFIISSCA